VVEQVGVKSITESEWLEELKEVRSEISIPGYWETLEANCKQWAEDISVGPFWSEAQQKLEAWIAEYRNKTSGALLIKPGLPKFQGKTAKRIKSKLYQKRLKENNYKLEVFSEDGPPIPKLNDLVRTRISCQYVDGVEFLASKLAQLSKEMNMEHEHSREGRLEGYFAQHVNFVEDVFYRFGGGTKPGRVTCEIQLSTELANRVWETTHLIYEESRETDEKAEEWQWNPKDTRFISRQLGHMIHLADGLLVQLRESTTQRKEVKK
jgi:ppGpp synthetase/RelA/SpoT-type nucleotidyltranferase